MRAICCPTISPGASTVAPETTRLSTLNPINCLYYLVGFLHSAFPFLLLSLSKYSLYLFICLSLCPSGFGVASSSCQTLSLQSLRVSDYLCEKLHQFTECCFVQKEKRIFMNDYMTGVPASLTQLYTTMTFALFEDSGCGLLSEGCRLMVTRGLQ